MNQISLRPSALAGIWVPMMVLIVFGLYYGSITFVNHSQYRTHAYDLGYYTHVVSAFGQLRMEDAVIDNATYWHTWGDHFEPVLALIGPLVHIFGSYTVLIVQLLAVLLGAVGVLRYFEMRSSDPWVPSLAMAQFLSIWGIGSALSFDFHASVLGAMVVPWVFLYFYTGSNWKLAAMTVLMLACGEKLAFWGIFVFLGLFLLHWRDARRRMIALSGALACIIWTFVSMRLIMPLFLKPGQSYSHFNFAIWGESLPEVAVNILTHPGKAIRLLFESHTPELGYSLPLKRELWKMIFLSGGIALLRRPQYLLMLLPVLLTKLYNDRMARWGINLQYSIEFVPILCIGLYEWVANVRGLILRRSLAGFVLVLTLVSTLVSLNTRYRVDYDPVQANPFIAAHWHGPEFEVKELEHALSLVPEEAGVSATDLLLPRLALHRRAYLFPTLLDADYAVVQLRFGTYPLSPERAEEVCREMVASKEWTEVWRGTDVVVMRRKAALMLGQYNGSPLRPWINTTPE